MQKLILRCLVLISFNLSAAEQSSRDTTQEAIMAKEHPVVQIKTNLGDIKVELYPEEAPETVKNFLSYANEGHYNNTIFHRVIKGFMIQGGGFTKDMDQKPTKDPINIESDNGLKNERGTIAMARTSDPNSATSQFFINLVNNDFLNFSSNTVRGYGYTVFGKVIDGMDVVDKIAAVKTGSKEGHQDVPTTTVEILEIKKI